ncbi:XerC Integrase [uncultured Caudovirales phage]|uniref:Integrase n=1 Tax=uncultured Caudovirales phage TaxID=2100421 RepID=A0A6J5QBU4_9CAUD|nr:XerC Integrase [uncultured Caudovirales phage]CAB4178675.1 XerC Integrase [uncultured Caudovirales phage]CAB4187893.1 XerC Integrase [uncultured Caudovirales phage]CAB4220469.1 XerC Integrase [uncultured Caudovirales phage]
MASISRYGRGYRAQVFVRGRRKSKTFRTMREAQAWGGAEEAKLASAPANRHTFEDLIDRYVEEVMPGKKGGDHEARQARALVRDFPALAAKRLAEIDTPDMAAWRDARLKVVSDATILRQINWLRHAFRIAREEWKWMEANPLQGMRLPKSPAARTRRVSPAEVRLLCRTLDYRPGRAPQTKQQEVALAFMVGLRSGMRAGEILSLCRPNLDLRRRVASVQHKTQHITGKPRDVPLTRHAVRLLRPVADREQCFSISSAVLDTLFRKARDRLLIEDLHFHDSRAEALTRLARKVDVMTLAKISGHKDVRLLVNAYYRETAEQIAARLG